MTSAASVFVGCKISQADGEQALAELEAAGLSVAARHDEADVVVVHTCCVTAEAERKSRRLVRRFNRLGRRVIVSGCAARLNPEQFAAAGVEVAAAPNWAALAHGAGGEGKGVPVGGDDREQSGVASAADASGRTRFVLKAQDGCAGRCTYCAVRLVRGEPHSVPLADALAAASAALGRGCGEVVLSGIDLGAWRDGELRLPDLVTALADLPGLCRLRLSSLEPRHVDARLLEVLAHERVARHLHLPLQSADDGVLADMNRPYTFVDYMAVAERARARLGDGMLSTDVIVGYPSEDEAAFARTLRVLESGLFGRVHVFAFSARPGTAAAELPPLPAAVVDERRRRALAAAQTAAEAARRSALGRPAEVLVEQYDGGLWKGYSSEYIPYYVEGDARRGELVRVVGRCEHNDGVLAAAKGEADE